MEKTKNFNLDYFSLQKKVESIYSEIEKMI